MYKESLYTFINKQKKTKSKMKKVMIAFGFVTLSLLTACGGSTPEGETKATDSTSVCVACPEDSAVVAVAVDAATVTPADTTK